MLRQRQQATNNLTNRPKIIPEKKFEIPQVPESSDDILILKRTIILASNWDAGLGSTPQLSKFSLIVETILHELKLSLFTTRFTYSNTYNICNQSHGFVLRCHFPFHYCCSIQIRKIVGQLDSPTEDWGVLEYCEQPKNI